MIKELIFFIAPPPLDKYFEINYEKTNQLLPGYYEDFKGLCLPFYFKK
jgi:hypothetical protein